MSIKGAYKLGALVIARLSKKRFIYLATRRRPFYVAHKHD
jgi:hypothetical protein